VAQVNNFDAFPKSQKSRPPVIPAKAVNQCFLVVAKSRHTGENRCDGFLQDHQL
jgi:hypothetical protein